MNEQEKYIKRVCQTALFFWEMFEEKRGDGHTQAIKLLKPTSKVSNVKIREFILNDLYKSQGLSLTEAAVQFATWLSDLGASPWVARDIESALRSECAPYENKLCDITKEEWIERSYIRLARYYRMVYEEDNGPHTRAPDYFIPLEGIPQGESHSGTSHPEHVVPCAVIRNYCLKYFEENQKYWSLDEVVKLIRKLLVIVYISEAERIMLDVGPDALKDRMPSEWDFDNGCIFDRLHKAKKEIKFVLHSGLTCAHQTK